MIIDKLKSAGVISCPKWLDGNSIAYLTITGSMAYGVNTNDSDLDIYGFCMPPREIIFPHTIGIIKNFGNQGEQFDQWSQHHIKSPDSKTEYDFSIYSIVKYFDLCMANNPNMVDTLFTPDNCVIHRSKVSDIVRSNRRLFLHKGAWHKFKGYAFAQMKRYSGENQNQKVGGVQQFMRDHEISNIEIERNINEEIQNRSSRASDQKVKTGLEHLTDVQFSKYLELFNTLNPRQVTSLEVEMDTKAAYHIVRLLLEAEQILIEGDLDLQRNREQLKSIRRGDWTIERLKSYFEEKEKALEQVYIDSKLPYAPDEQAIRNVLLNCLEEHYGDLSQAVKRDTSVEHLLADLKAIMSRYGA